MMLESLNLPTHLIYFIMTVRTTALFKHPAEEIFWSSPMILDRYFSLDEFREMAERYPDLRMEREQNGKIRIMSPVKAGSGKRENKVGFFLTRWNYEKKLGEVFSPSTGIYLPDGAVKSPDVAWVSNQRMKNVSPEEEENDFLQVVPDFIIEIRSQTDRISRLKRKMTDTWMKNGVRLGWLIDPFKEQVYIYRGTAGPQTLAGFDGRQLNGEDVLPGFELPLEELKLKKR